MCASPFYQKSSLCLPAVAVRILWIAFVLISALAPSDNRKPAGPTLAAPTVLARGSKGAERFSIFGKDDRTQISNTRVYPWSAIALIRIYWSADDLVGDSCTGWMIGPSALATAAHCIYQGGHPYRVVVKPAMNSADPEQLPFGACAVESQIVPDAWVRSRDLQYDYGVLRLGCTAGLQTGTLGFKATSGDWMGKTLRLSGYPGDKPGRTMWTALGQVTSSSAKGLYYDIDMWPGQSGSPVWDTSDPSCPYCVVAINSSQFPAPTMNFGARIDLAAFDFLQREKDYRPAAGG